MRTFSRMAFAVAFALASAQGCSWAPSLGVYKLEIVQGNYVTQDMVDRLQVGMTRQQVRTALGTPLVSDVFHPSRWDYVFERQRQGRRVGHHAFRVFFEDDRLARWEGGDLPESPLAAAPSGPSMPGIRTTPVPEERGWLDRVLEPFKR
jgi:outer membrane protein assembly factor BamE